jgi:hypothetical protein
MEQQHLSLDTFYEAQPDKRGEVGAGALHGLNPATGWIFAAARGMRSRDRARALQALVPIAVGHAASIAMVFGAVLFGLSMDRVVLQAVAGGLLGVLGLCWHQRRRLIRSMRLQRA